jgi:ribosomal protein S18 acetylase RimI-like enzyme
MNRNDTDAMPYHGNLLIREAVPGDAQAMAEIHISSWIKAYTGIIPADEIEKRSAGRYDVWKNALSSGHNNYIALLDGRPAGLMRIHPCRDENLKGAGEIGAVYVHGDLLGKGIGRKMIEFALDKLKNMGFSIVVLWVLEDNMRARRFYEKCGFCLDGTRRVKIIGIPLTTLRYRIDLT